MNKEAISPPVNSQSILSLVFGIFTLLSFCTGLFPIPFTGFICFPISFLFGVLALAFGFVSLKRICKQKETGSPMAWMGIILSGGVFLCVMCMIVTLVSLFVFAPDSVPTPPFIQNLSI